MSKPSDLPTRLEAVKNDVAQDPTLDWCEEVLKVYEFFQDAGVNVDHTIQLTAITIDNLWEEE